MSVDVPSDFRNTERLCDMEILPAPPKVTRCDVAAAEGRLQHVEANGDALHLERIHLLFRYNLVHVSISVAADDFVHIGSCAAPARQTALES